MSVLSLVLSSVTLVFKFIMPQFIPFVCICHPFSRYMSSLFSCFCFCVLLYSVLFFSVYTKSLRLKSAPVPLFLCPDMAGVWQEDWQLNNKKALAEEAWDQIPFGRTSNCTGQVTTTRKRKWSSEDNLSGQTTLKSLSQRCGFLACLYCDLCIV